MLKPEQAPINRLFVLRKAAREPPPIISTDDSNRSTHVLRDFRDHCCSLTFKYDHLAKYKYCYGLEDFISLVLCHAQMYVLGDRYELPELKELSLHLLETLLIPLNDEKSCKVKENRRKPFPKEVQEGLIELVRYTYSHTASSGANGLEPLRELLVAFLVPNFYGLLHQGKKRVYESKLEDSLPESGEFFLDIAIGMALDRTSPPPRSSSSAESSTPPPGKVYNHGSLSQGFQSMHLNEKSG